MHPRTLRTIIILSLLCYWAYGALLMITVAAPFFIIELDPPQPSPFNAITATVQGDWPDSCIPAYISQQRQQTFIQILTARPDQTCLEVITPFTLPIPINPLRSGAYTLDFVGAFTQTVPFTVTGSTLYLPLISTQQADIPGQDAPAVVIQEIFYDGQVPQVESDEYALIANLGATPVNLQGWRLNAGNPGQDFTLPSFELQAASTCRVYTNELHPDTCGFSCESGSAIWNNAGDCGYLYNATGTEVSLFCYGTPLHTESGHQ